MFTLAHLSDLHLASRPRLVELAGKRGLGFINWQRKRKNIHRPEVLDAITRDLKAQRARPHRGDRRSGQSLAAGRIPAGARVARNDRRCRPTSLSSPAITTSMSAASKQCPAAVSGATTCAATTACNAFRFVRRRGDVALIALSTGVPTAPFLATGRLGNRQLARLRRTARSNARTVPHRADPSSAC